MEISRKSFLGGAAMLGAGAVFTGLAGTAFASESGSASATDSVSASASGSVSASGSASVSAAATSSADAAESYDLVVVGSGTAGTCAALHAAESGASVLVVEKNDVLGGTSNMAEGLCGINTRYQAEQGIEIDATQVLEDTMQYHHYACSGPVVRAFVDTCGAVVDWIESEGITWASVASLGNSYQVWHLPADDTGAPTHMSDVLAVLQANAQTAGAEFRTDAPMTGLVVEDGVVTGITIDQDGADVTIAAKAVILASGGYANNAEMFEQFTGRPYESAHVWGMEGRDGDGIRFACEQAGADTHLPSAVMYHTGMLDGTTAFSDIPNFVLTMQPTMRVNESGKRYFDESATSNFSSCGNVLTTQAENYVLFDDGFIDYIETSGPFMPMPNLGAFVGQPFECRDGLLACDAIVQGDTIEEVAEGLGLDSQIVADTVERYNGFCENGVDEDFGKPAEMLLGLTKAPFYGAKITPTLFTTVGALRVNENMQVMGTDGQPIAGLYAAGGDAAGLYGANYDVDICSGSQQGWSATSGYIAAGSALA